MDQTHEIRRIDELLPHPLYTKFYPEMSEDTIKGFIAAIEQSNYISPIIITAENIILDGHHRYWAAKRMGIETLSVTVKRITEREANILLNTFNCARSKTLEDKIFLAKRIRAVFQYYEIKPGPNNCHDGTIVTAKDIAKMFGISYRTMIRILKLLDVIPELQYKFKNDEIGIRAIEKIANELDEQQQKILHSQIFDRKLKEENLIQLIDAIIDDHVIGSNESGSHSTESNNKKSMVIKDAEKNLKKLHEKVILHSHIFKENLAAVQLILSGLEDIKHELEEIKNGKKHP